MLLYIVHAIINNTVVGEFNTPLAIMAYRIYASLFFTGWLCGYGFSRSKIFMIIWSLLLLVLQIIVVSKIAEIKSGIIIAAFVPVVAYALYILYTAELINNMNEADSRPGFFILKRMALFKYHNKNFCVKIFKLLKTIYTFILNK